MDLTQVDPIASVIAVLAFGVSVWSVVASRSVGRMQNSLQERLLNLETAREADRVAEGKRAELRATIIGSGSVGYQLVIVNEGVSQARNVEVRVDGQTLVEHDRCVVKESDVVRDLGRGAHIGYPLAIAFGTQSLFDVAVSWEDSTGEPGRWHSQLGWK